METSVRHAYQWALSPDEWTLIVEAARLPREVLLLGCLGVYGLRNSEYQFLLEEPKDPATKREPIVGDNLRVEGTKTEAAYRVIRANEVAVKYRSRWWESVKSALLNGTEPYRHTSYVCAKVREVGQRAYAEMPRSRRLRHLFPHALRATALCRFYSAFRDQIDLQIFAGWDGMGVANRYIRVSALWDDVEEKGKMAW